MKTLLLKFKYVVREWLGINEDVQAIAKDMNSLGEAMNHHGINAFEIFHVLPYAAAVMSLTAADAARLTAPHGIQANSLSALLTGILLKARQGDSNLEVQGTLDDDTRGMLVRRGFQVEDIEGTAGKFTHIIWA